MCDIWFNGNEYISTPLPKKKKKKSSFSLICPLAIEESKNKLIENLKGDSLGEEDVFKSL
jgi:hypothetical protein